MTAAAEAVTDVAGQRLEAGLAPTVLGEPGGDLGGGGEGYGTAQAA